MSADAIGANNGRIDGQSGFHTEYEAFPWWQVDLGKACLVRALRIYNRNECADRLRAFTIMGSLDGTCWQVLHRKADRTVFGANDLHPYTCLLPREVVARHIRIQLDGTDFLHFCECEILGIEFESGDSGDDDVRVATTSTEEFEFVIAGHSHVFALGASINYVGEPALMPVGDCPDKGYFLMSAWEKGRGKEYWHALAEHSEGRVAVLVFHGNQHFANFLFLDEPFDFVDAADRGQALLQDAVVVPRRMVKASPLLMPGELRTVIRQLLARGCRCVIVTGTPPVREDFVAQVAALRHEPMWRSLAARLGVDILSCSSTPPSVMMKLWRVMQEHLSDAARDSGARFLPVPDECFNADGYLSEQFRGPLWNFTHANLEFGHLMLHRIRHAVSQVGLASCPPLDI